MADGIPGAGSGVAAPAPTTAEVLTRLPVPERAAGVELFGETPGSGYREPPSLVRRSDGQTIQLTPLLYAVLQAVDGERGWVELAARVSERIGRTATPVDVLYLVEHKLRPLGVLRNPDGSEPAVRKANPLLALKARVVISNPDLTRRITRPFAALFRPTIITLFLAAFAGVAWWLFFEHSLASSLHEAFYTPHLLLLVFLLTLVSAGFHEFGHAAACRYGGATPGAMGFGLYLIWPVFYTDVTDSYRLGRGGRLRVDLGGLYFNAIVAVATFAVWAWLRADALLLLIVAQLLQMSRQLAPLVRFDGYHILADLTGVPDLFAHIKPTLLGLLPSRWRRGQHQALKPWARAVVTLWVLLVVPLLAILLVTIVLVLPRLAATAWDSLGVQVDVLGQNWADGDLANVGLRLLSIFALAVPVLSMTYLLGRVGRRAAVRVWEASRGSRPRRAAAGLGGIALLMAVAWAWWPGGQYTPVEPDEELRIAEMFHLQGTPVAAPAERAPNSVPTAWPVADAGHGGGVPQPPALPVVGPPELGVVLIPSTQDVEPGVTYVADDAEADDLGDAWPFPWHTPPPVSEGDNRAIAINTEDGSTLYDVALAFVWVTDGGPVDERNEAFAYASCTDCTTTAVAFQVILIVGQADTIIPVNTAVAANYECESCSTQALAVQLVVTLAGVPSDEVLSDLGRVWAEVERLQTEIEHLTLDEIYLWLMWAELQILEILANGDSLEDAHSEEALTATETDGVVVDGEEPVASTTPAGEPVTDPLLEQPELEEDAIAPTDAAGTVPADGDGSGDATPASDDPVVVREEDDAASDEPASDADGDDGSPPATPDG